MKQWHLLLVILLSSLLLYAGTKNGPLSAFFWLIVTTIFIMWQKYTGGWR